MVSFHGLCDGRIMIVYFFSQKIRARYLIGDYASCNRCSVLYDVLNFLKLYAKTFLNFEESQLFEKDELNYKELI